MQTRRAQTLFITCPRAVVVGFSEIDSWFGKDLLGTPPFVLARRNDDAVEVEKELLES